MTRLRRFLVPLLAVSLAACASHVASIQSLPIDPGAALGASDTAVAVDASGNRHYAWIECANGCSLVYARMHFDTEVLRLRFSPPLPGDFYRSPDIAATAAGDAVIVFRGLPDAPTFPPPYRDLFVDIPAAQTAADPLPAVQSVAPGAIGALPPLAVGGADTIYALYAIASASGSELHARRLRPLAAASPIATAADRTIAGARGWIDQHGNLHVAYQAVSTLTNEQWLAYAIAGTATSAPIASGAALFSLPDIVVDSDDTAFVVYASDQLDDTLTLYSRTSAGSVSVGGLALPAADGPWQITSAPRLIFDIFDKPLVAFAASNAATGAHREVWLARGSLNPAVTRLTDDTSGARGVPAQPELTIVGAATVVAWRTFDPKVGADCLRDTVLWDSAYGLRTIQAGVAGRCYDSFDLAGNGAWAAGVWDRSEPAGGGRAIPWTTYNVAANAIPLLAR